MEMVKIRVTCMEASVVHVTVSIKAIGEVTKKYVCMVYRELVQSRTTL